MLAVLTVELALDQVVDVAFVRDRDVLAADAMDVVVRVARGPATGITGPHVASVQLMLVDVAVVRVMQVPVVRVVDVLAVPDRDVTAPGTVVVLVLVVDERFHKSWTERSTAHRARQTPGRPCARAPWL